MVPYPRAVARFPTLRQSLLAKAAECGPSAGYEIGSSIVGPDADGLTTSGWTTHPQARGQIAHAVIARALRLMVEEGEVRTEVAVVQELLDDELRQADKDPADVLPVPPAQVQQLRTWLGVWAKRHALSIEQVAGIEERLRAVVRYPGLHGEVVERVLTGQLDVLLIAGPHATVIDWKDTWKLPPRRRDPDPQRRRGLVDDGLSDEGYFQQRFYAFLVFVMFPGVESVTLREFYLRHGEPREATLWRDRDFRGLEAEFAALAERFDRAVEHEVWGQPAPGSHCVMCPGAAVCPITPDARRQGAIRTREDAERLAGEVIQARAVVKRHTEALSSWISRNGAVRVHDGKAMRLFGFERVERTARPTRDELERAIASGRDPAELYRVRTGTRLTDYDPLKADEELLVDDAELVDMFERAAAAAKATRGGRAA